jgi:DNA primase
VKQVVATAGTALTEQQLKALGRFTGDIRLSFDADKAGVNATERSIPIASKVGVSLSIITIPSGKDPDELIKQDATIWRSIIEEPKYALDWLIMRYENLLDIESAQGKRQFSDVILNIIRGLQDPVEQEHYIGQVGKRIGVSQEALLSKLKDPVTKPKLRPKKTENKPVDRVSLEVIKKQNHLLALVLLQPKLRMYLEPLKPQMLAEDNAKELLQFLEANPDFNGEPATAASLRPLADYVKMLSLLFEELYQSREVTELHGEAARLQAFVVERYVKSQKARIAHELQNADQDRITQLQELDIKLNHLLKTYT